METTDRLDIIYSLTALLAITESMKISVNELKKSDKPTAIPYIEGMEKHIVKMQEVYNTMKSMESEIKILSRMNFNYHTQLMDLKFKLKDLKSENNNLKDSL